MALKRQCGGDAISKLPDALLGHILSYVPTKQSVRTSILSKLWVRVWTNVPSIDIDDSTLLLQEPKLVTDHSVHTSFIRFMNCVFDRCKEAPIREFTLKSTVLDLFVVNSWILSAVEHKIRKLDLYLTDPEHFTMSCGLFAYRELFSLKLGQDFVLRVPDLFSCPSLKKLHLDEVEFDDDSIRKFLSGCPVLEDLHIETYSSKHWDTLVVNAPALKVLTFNTYDNNTGDEEFDNYKFVLECPNLEKLNYSGHVGIKSYCFENLDSLYEAHIDVGSVTISEHDETAFRRRAVEIARGISRAKIIHLTDYTLEIFSLMDDDLPIFHNVFKLALGVSEHCSGELFSQLLHNSPNTEHLVLNTDLALKGDANSFEWGSPDRVPECFSQHLKFVKIWGFREDKTSVVSEFINYVVQNAKVLERCFASPHHSNLEDEVKFNRQLLNYI